MDFGTVAPSVWQEHGEQVEWQHCPVGNDAAFASRPVEREAEGCHGGKGCVGHRVHPGVMQVIDQGGECCCGVKQDEEFDGVAGEGCSQQGGEAGETPTEG